MEKNTLFTIAALAIIATVGYAAYTNGSITDLSTVVNNQIGEVVSGSSNYLGAIISTQSLATSTTKAAGTRERNLPGTLKILPIDPKTLNVDSEKSVRFFEFQITARKNNDDVIKYIDFQISGRGVPLSSMNLEVFRGKDLTQGSFSNGSVHFVSGDPKNKFVIRYNNDEYSQSELTIPKGETRSYALRTYLYRANENSPLSVRILKIAR